MLCDTVPAIAHETSRLRIGMGTMIAVDATAVTAEVAARGVELAFAAIAQVERLMHPTRSGSDLVAIREASPGVCVSVHSWTWQVLALSQRLNHLTGGAFDPCVPESAGRICDLELAAPQCVIAHRPLRIDLGGIAKGFAVDRALEALREAGCSAGLVNAGGDLAVFGGRTPIIAIRGRDGRGCTVRLTDAALAASDVNSVGRPAEHRGYYHGRTLGPVAAGRVMVCAPVAAIADALTKCLLVPGTMQAALLRLFDARLVVEAERA